MGFKKWLPLLGIILFVYILVKIDLLEVLGEIKNVDVFFLLIALAMVVVMFFIQTFKWFTIAVFQDIKIPFLEAFKINLIGNFYGFVTPSKLGTIVRAEYLKKYTGNIGKGLCNFTLDKALDLVSIIFMAILFSFIFRGHLNLPIGVFIGLFFGFILIGLFFLNKDRSKFVLGIFYKKFIPEKMKEKAKLTFESFYEDMPEKRYFILFLLLNIINWMVIFSIIYFIGLSLGIELGFIYYLAIFPIATLVAMIPITINGLGTQEVTLIGLFGLFGVEATKVFSMSMVNLIIGILSSLVGVFFIYRVRE